MPGGPRTGAGAAHLCRNARRGLCRRATAKLGESLSILLDELGLEVEPVTAACARRVGTAYAAWGKGMHPAGLNFGDCFAYALAKDRDLPLLFIGRDFARTDVRPAISRDS